MAAPPSLSGGVQRSSALSSDSQSTLDGDRGALGLSARSQRALGLMHKDGMRIRRKVRKVECREQLEIFKIKLFANKNAI